MLLYVIIIIIIIDRTESTFMHLCVGLYERIMSLKSVLNNNNVIPVGQCDIASVLPNLHFLRDGLFSTVSHLPNA